MGRGAHVAKSHQQHFACVRAFINSLKSVTEGVFTQLEAAIRLKTASEEPNGRMKRSPSALPLAISIGSLISTGKLCHCIVSSQKGEITSEKTFPACFCPFVSFLAGLGIYFGMSIQSLSRYVEQLERRMINEEEFSDSIARNTKLLQHEGETIGLKTNIISTSFLRFRLLATCNLFRIAQTVEKNRLYARMDSFANSIIGGKLNPRVLPIDLLGEILKDSNLLAGSLLEKNPLAIYNEASISLRSINREKYTVTILLAIPKINSQADFMSLNIISPKTVVFDGIKHKSLQLQLPTNLFVPRSLFLSAEKFPLEKDEDFDGIRKLGDCNWVEEARICSNVFPLTVVEKDCLRSAVLGIPSNGACHMKQGVVSAEPTFSVEEGEMGVLISAPDSFSIFGVTGKKKERLSVAAKHSDRRICLYIPSRYDVIKIQNATYTGEIKRTIRTTMEMSEGTTEVGYFHITAPQWTDEKDLERNVTLVALEKMVRKKFFGGFLSTGVSLEMVLVSVLTVLLIIAFLFVFLIHRGYIRIHVRRGRDAEDLDMPNRPRT